MALLPILRFPDPRLKKVAQPVVQIDASIRKLVADMAETMYEAPGIGLAATQVDVHQRVVVIDVSEEKNDLLAFINPTLEKCSGEQVGEEGCLSGPGIYDKVERAGRGTIKYLHLPANASDQSRVKPALGKFSGENSVPLAKDAFPGKTVIILGEDANNGQVYLYVSNTPGDLESGKLYALRRTNLNQVETSMSKGNSYDVEFVEVPDAKNMTGTQIENLNSTLKSIQFARVEDLDYRKGGGANSREIYFTATGVSGVPEKTYWGRVYRLKLNAASPLQGTLEVVEDGDLNPGAEIINPDNLCVTDNYVFIQEDGDSFFPGASHNSLIWQYDIAKCTKKKMIDLKNKLLGGTKYNPANDQRFATWEWGAMVDISDIIGVPNTFTVNIHPHSWVENDRFLNPSKAVNNIQSYKAGGQTLILKGVPR